MSKRKGGGGSRRGNLSSEGKKPKHKSRFMRGIQDLPETRAARAEPGAFTEFVQRFGDGGDDVGDAQAAESRALEAAGYSDTVFPVGATEDQQAAILAGDAVQRRSKRKELERVRRRKKKKKKAEDAARRKKAHSKPWEALLFEAVPFDERRLKDTNPKAHSSFLKKRAVDGEPEFMYACMLSPYAIVSEKEHPGKHPECFLINMRAVSMQNHMDSFHRDVCVVMQRQYEDDCHEDRLLKARDMFFDTQQRAALTPSVRAGRPICSFFQPVKKSKYRLSSTEKTEIALMLWLVESECSFNSLRHQAFATFKSIAGFNGIRGQTCLTDLIRPLHAVALQHQEKRIQACGFFSTTFDYWKGVCGDDYLGITYHACDDDFNLVECVLDLVYTPNKKFSVNIATQVQACVNSHTTDECIHVASVTDKAADVKKASQMLTGDDAKWCFNHEIKKVIDDCFEGTTATPATALLAKKVTVLIRDVSAWVRTDKDENMLLCAMQKVEKPVQLLVENDTRWEGKFRSVERFLRLRAALVEMKPETGSQLWTMMAKDFDPDVAFPGFAREASGAEQDAFWRLVTQIKDILGTFHKASMFVQGEEYPTLSSIPYWCWRITNSLAAVTDDAIAIKELKTALKASFKKRTRYYMTTCNNALKAAALDPRFADLARLGVDDVTISEVWFSIKEEELQFSNIDVTDNEVQRNRWLKSLDGDIKNCQEALCELSANWFENGCRLEDTGVDFETRPGPINPLDFWRAATKEGTPAPCGDCNWRISEYDSRFFSALKKAARVLLSIPAGSAPSERIFSGAGRVYTPGRSRLGEDQLERLVVLRNYLCWKGYDFTVLCNDLQELLWAEQKAQEESEKQIDATTIKTGEQNKSILEKESILENR